MDEKQILKMVGETLTNKKKPVTIDIPVRNSIHKKLMDWGWLPKTKTYMISPILVGNRYRVSSVAIGLPDDTFDNGVLDFAKAWQAVNDHTEDFIYIVAVCIQNREKEPSNRLLKKLRWINDEDFFKLLDVSLTQAGLPSFMKSIVLIKGQSVLNVPEPAVIPAKEQE